MGLPLFYFAPEMFDRALGRVVIEGADARHLSSLLRVRPSDRVVLGDGAGMVLQATVTAVGEGRVEVAVTDTRTAPRELPAINLVQGLCKPTAMDEAIGMAAECGVASLTPMLAPRSLAGLRQAGRRGERWDRLAREASMLARRAWPLAVGETVQWPPPLAGCTLLLWEDEERTALADRLPDDPPGRIDIVVGPEGGFSADEVEVLRGAGAVSVSLGGLNLRSASAGSYAAVLVRAHYGLLAPPEGTTDG